jgi:tRNA 2-thiouridine synthesizing protein E
MTLDVNGKALDVTENGYLVNMDEWNEEVASAMASADGIAELTDKHWDVINFLRDEYTNNGGNQPNDRKIIKAMSDKWGGKISQKDLYDLFPGKPDKQASKLGGLPETRRKGGY